MNIYKDKHATKKERINLIITPIFTLMDELFNNQLCKKVFRLKIIYNSELKGHHPLDYV